MDKRGLSLANIQEVPRESLTLLTGPPGAGKSAFCHQVVLNSIVTERLVIFITTEQSPSGVTGLLKEKGMGEYTPGALSFVDAFTETVGLTCAPREDTVCANCADLNSLSMATTKLQERMGQKGILLAFDSLTSPYLFCGAEITRFMRLFLSRFAAEGNSVLVLMDEGCGKPEDLVAMMSIADGVIKIETQKDKRLFEVVKHPKVEPTRIEIPIKPKPTIKSAFDVYKSTVLSDPSQYRQWIQSMSGQAVIRSEVGDFVNLFWPQFVRWSTMLWDPKGFPTMVYDYTKVDAHFSATREGQRFLPWRLKLLGKFILSLQALGFFSKNFSKVKDMKRMGDGPWHGAAQWERSGTMEYLEDISKTDEHYFRVYENSDCWGFENIGASIASHIPPHMAGLLEGFEKDGRDWNTVETKCIGLGDPYCEFKLVPGKIGELRSSLEKDASVVERIHDRLMERLMGFLLHGKPLADRPRLGSDVHIHVTSHVMGFALLGERYRMALKMGGARAGKKVGERLMEAGLSEDEAVKRILHFLEHCNVGKVTLDETIRIRENCESLSNRFFVITEEPSCYFTTGFLNGLFSAVKNKHVREIRCFAAGDPYCEWEIT